MGREREEERKWSTIWNLFFIFLFLCCFHLTVSSCLSFRLSVLRVHFVFVPLQKRTEDCGQDGNGNEASRCFAWPDSLQWTGSVFFRFFIFARSAIRSSAARPNGLGQKKKEEGEEEEEGEVFGKRFSIRKSTFRIKATTKPCSGRCGFETRLTRVFSVSRPFWSFDDAFYRVHHRNRQCTCSLNRRGKCSLPFKSRLWKKTKRQSRKSKLSGSSLFCAFQNDFGLWKFR